MMKSLVAYWEQRSTREQWMLGVMVALLVGVFLWLGVARPLAAAREDSREALRAATDRNASIRASVKALKVLPAAPSTGPAAPLDQVISQSASEAGLTLERAQPQGDARMDIAIASVRPIALLSWIAALEGQGIRVETIRAQPGGSAGSVSVQALLVRGDGA
ncbi:MAG: type II secretion system protein M [Sphingobium sp.]